MQFLVRIGSLGLIGCLCSPVAAFSDKDTIEDERPWRIRVLDSWGPVPSVAFSPDGNHLLSGVERTVTLWKISSRTCVASLSVTRTGKDKDEKGLVEDVAFSPDGKWFAALRSDGLIRLWDASTLREVRTFHLDTQTLLPDADLRCKINNLAISPDSKQLAVGYRNWAKAGSPGEARVFDVRTGQQLAVLRRHKDSAPHVQYHPSGRYLLTSALAAEIYNSWDTTHWRQIDSEIPKRPDTLLSWLPTFSPDGKQLLLTEFQIMRIWDLEKHRYTVRTPLTGENVVARAWSPDGRWIATTYDSPYAVVDIWDAADLKPLTRLTYAPECTLYSLAFSPDGTLVAAAGQGEHILVWPIRSRK
jgi:WD40 repeat protein